MGKLTIQDIARLAGVSTATVSRAIHSPKLLREETLKHVLAVIEQHQYIYNAVAGDFSRQKSSILSAFVPWSLSGGKINATLIAVQDVVSPYGYPMLLNITNFNEQTERMQLMQTRERAPAGLFFAGYTVSNEEMIREILAGGVPGLFLWEIMPGTPYHYVGIDNFAASVEMTRYLIGLGHRRIGFVGALFSKVARSRQRLDGFRTALGEAGLRVREDAVLEYPSALQSGCEAMHRLLALPDPPTAVFLAGDALAIGALAACREAGVSVPRDMSVAGFDDMEFSSYAVPALTTVQVPSLEMGRIAGRCMLELVRGGDASPRQYCLKTSLVIRESCAPPLRRSVFAVPETGNPPPA